MLARRPCTCPQFDPKLVNLLAEGPVTEETVREGLVTEGTNARNAVPDPPGADIENGQDLYFTPMRNMTKATACPLDKASLESFQGVDCSPIFI